MRWIGKELDEGVALILEGKMFIYISLCIFRPKKRGIDIKGPGMVGSLAGGVGTLSYEHHNISEPAILYVSLLSSLLSLIFPIFLYIYIYIFPLFFIYSPLNILLLFLN